MCVLVYSCVCVDATTLIGQLPTRQSSPVCYNPKQPSRQGASLSLQKALTWCLCHRPLGATGGGDGGRSNAFLAASSASALSFASSASNKLMALTASVSVNTTPDDGGATTATAAAMGLDALCRATAGCAGPI